MIPELVVNEAERQKNLAELKNRVKELKKPELKDLSDVFENTECGFIKEALKRGEAVTGFKLEGWNGVLGEKTTGRRRVGTEIADYAKTRGFGGIIHGDEDLEEYSILEEEKKKIMEKLSIEEEDNFILLSGKKRKAKKTIKKVLLPRLNQLSKGVPKEVRKAEPDGTTTYLRPMPGAARMYPETDIPVIEIEKDNIKTPKLLTERIQEMKEKYGIKKSQVEELIKKGIELEKINKKYENLKPKFLAETFTDFEKELKKRHDVEIDVYKNSEEVLRRINKGDIPKSALEEIMIKKSRGEEIDYEDYEKISREEVKKILEKIVSENKGAPVGALMGEAMKELKGKVEGREVKELLNELIDD